MRWAAVTFSLEAIGSHVLTFHLLGREAHCFTAWQPWSPLWNSVATHLITYPRLPQSKSRSPPYFPIYTLIPIIYTTFYTFSLSILFSVVCHVSCVSCVCLSCSSQLCPLYVSLVYVFSLSAEGLHTPRLLHSRPCKFTANQVGSFLIVFLYFDPCVDYPCTISIPMLITLVLAPYLYTCTPPAPSAPWVSIP